MSFPVSCGGWPGWFRAGEGEALTQASSYIEDISQYDLPAVAGPRRDPRA